MNFRDLAQKLATSAPIPEPTSHAALVVERPWPDGTTWWLEQYNVYACYSKGQVWLYRPDSMNWELGWIE